VTAGWPLPQPWINFALAGQPSGQTLAALEAALKAAGTKPQIVHIMVGNEDALAQNPEDYTATTNNIQQMVQLVQAAGVKVIVGTTAPTAYVPSDPLSAIDDNLTFINHWIADTLAVEPGVVIVNYAGPLTGGSDAGVGCSTPYTFCYYDPQYTTTGYVPNAAGYAIMTPLAEAAVETLASAETKNRQGAK
jgi:lysophospholipase L1-like esterase